MKTYLVTILIIFSNSAYACVSPPEGLIEQHIHQAKLYSLCALVFFLISVGLQLLNNRTKIWAPILYASLFCYIPTYLYHYHLIWSHGGMCGNLAIIDASIILVVGMALLLLWEIISYVRKKNTN